MENSLTLIIGSCHQTGKCSSEKKTLKETTVEDGTIFLFNKDIFTCLSVWNNGWEIYVVFLLTADLFQCLLMNMLCFISKPISFIAWMLCIWY